MLPKRSTLFDVTIPYVNYLGEGSDAVLFERVQPSAVVALLERTKGKLVNLMTAIDEVASSSSAERRKQLFCVGLPGSLEAFKSGLAIPESVWATVVRVQSQGGFEELKHKATDIDGSAARAVSIMDEIKSSILREETANLVFGQRLPMIVMQPSSDQLYEDVKVHDINANIVCD